MTFSPNLNQMTPEQLRALAAQVLQLQSQVEAMSRKIQSDETIIEQLTYEIALLRRHKFTKRSEQISPAQGSLLDNLLDTDLEDIEAELKNLLPVRSGSCRRISGYRPDLRKVSWADAYVNFSLWSGVHDE